MSNADTCPWYYRESNKIPKSQHAKKQESFRKFGSSGVTPGATALVQLPPPHAPELYLPSSNGCSSKTRARPSSGLFQSALFHPNLPNRVSLLPNANPISNSTLLRRDPYTSSAASHNQVSRSIILIQLHSPNDAAVHACVLGDVPYLSTRQRPTNRLPAIVGQVHSPKGNELHHLPRQDCGPT